MQSLLDRLVAEGRERGAQLAVYHQGKLIVDVWSGLADFAAGTKVQGDTLFPVFSVSKGITATVIHRLVEQGLLDYEKPIAAVWPEFAAKGKGGVTLRHGMSHMAGIPQMPDEADFEIIRDWVRMCELIAELEPLSPPGAKVEYHAITYSWILGEPARRVTGLPFGELLVREVTKPLGLEDSLYIGLPKERHNVAVLEHDVAPPIEQPGPQSVPARLAPLHRMMNRRDMQEACLPGASGVMSARAIARHYAALLPGGVDGVELLPPLRVRLATAFLESDPADAKHMLGYGAHGEPPQRGQEVTCFGHGGHGGSNGFADLDLGLAVGYTRNRLDDGEVPPLIFAELRKALAAL